MAFKTYKFPSLDVHCFWEWASTKCGLQVWKFSRKVGSIDARALEAANICEEVVRHQEKEQEEEGAGWQEC